MRAEILQPNIYAYVGGSPTSFVDPRGLWQVTIVFGAGWGGVLTFGKNSGQWNVGGFLGAGEGLAVDIDFRNMPCHEPGSHLEVFAAGEAGFGGGLGIEGEQHLQDTEDARAQFTVGVPGTGYNDSFEVENGRVTHPEGDGDIISHHLIFGSGAAVGVGVKTYH